MFVHLLVWIKKQYKMNGMYIKIYQIIIYFIVKFGSGTAQQSFVPNK